MRWTRSGATVITPVSEARTTYPSLVTRVPVGESRKLPLRVNKLPFGPFTVKKPPPSMARSREVAEVWSLLEDVVDLHERRCGAARIGECDIGVGHLDQGLDRDNGQGVGEKRSQPGATPKVEPRL